jgi:hypothetical protein
MNIHVQNDRTLQDIQTEFQEKFTHLKLEFYRKSHEEGQGTSDQYKLDASLTVGELRDGDATNEFSIHGNLKTSTFEESWQENFGFAVQVFRKSGNLWLQTTATDDWTLSEQQKAAEEYDQPAEL